MTNSKKLYLEMFLVFLLIASIDLLISLILFPALSSVVIYNVVVIVLYVLNFTRESTIFKWSKNDK